MTALAHEPRVLPRECGGWLAVSAPQDELRIGVTADTEEEARERFDTAVEAWLRLLAASERRGVDEAND